MNQQVLNELADRQEILRELAVATIDGNGILTESTKVLLQAARSQHITNNEWLREIVWSKSGPGR